MALNTPSTIHVDLITTPNSLSAFTRSLSGLPNNPASLYFSIQSQNLIVYVLPTSSIKIINLPDLKIALSSGDESAVAFKSFLETGTVIKVFFDARMPAKILFERCGIALAIEVRNARNAQFLLPCKGND